MGMVAYLNHFPVYLASNPETVVIVARLLTSAFAEKLNKMDREENQVTIQKIKDMLANKNGNNLLIREMIRG